MIQMFCLQGVANQRQIAKKGEGKKTKTTDLMMIMSYSSEIQEFKK